MQRGKVTIHDRRTGTLALDAMATNRVSSPEVSEQNYNVLGNITNNNTGNL